MTHRHFISIILILFFNTDQAFACDCLESGTVKTELKRTSLVALVRSIAQDTVEFVDQYGRKDFKWEYKFLVIRKYKGDTTSDTITVSTPYGETACGLFFKINQEYILYGHQWKVIKQKAVRLPDNTFETTSCTRTKAFDAKEEEAIKVTLKE